MAFDFPSSPVTNQIYVSGSYSYMFDGVKWVPITLPPSSNVASPPQHRLTLVTATPVMQASVTGVTFMRFTPYLGRQVPIWDGSRIQMYETPEIGQSLSDTTKSPAAAVAAKNYDLFVWNDNGTIRLSRGFPWTSDTSRGTGAGTAEIIRTAGILVNAQIITNGPQVNRGTYVGTIRTNAGAATVDFNLGGTASGGSAANIGIWNNYNRVPFTAVVGDNAAAYAYATAAWRPANNSQNNRCSFVTGMQEDFWDCRYSCDMGVVPSAMSLIGIAFDAIVGPVVAPAAATLSLQGATAVHAQAMSYITQQPIGFHYFQAMEYGGTGNTFNQGTTSPAGLFTRGQY